MKKPLPTYLFPEQRVIDLPPGVCFYTQQREFNPDDGCARRKGACQRGVPQRRLWMGVCVRRNSAVQVYFQLGPRQDRRMKVTAELVGQIAEARAFAASPTPRLPVFDVESHRAGDVLQSAAHR